MNGIAVAEAAWVEGIEDSWRNSVSRRITGGRGGAGPPQKILAGLTHVHTQAPYQGRPPNQQAVHVPDTVGIKQQVEHLVPEGGGVRKQIEQQGVFRVAPRSLHPAVRAPVFCLKFLVITFLGVVLTLVTTFHIFARNSTILLKLRG